MKIVMFTNTYRPHVGGVANSVTSFETQLREKGHDVLIVAPTFEGATESDATTVRVRAIQNFNGSDFSVRIPQPSDLNERLNEFAPEIVHSHHPFLLGDTALRTAYSRGIPLVFTHHTLYERYTHYVPLDSPALKQLAIQIAVEYCNLCDLVIAPSSSVKKLLVERKVTRPLEVLPTGVDTQRFASASGRSLREQHGVSDEDCVIGHVGRLAKEKNLPFLVDAVTRAMKNDSRIWFLVAGDGDAREAMQESFREQSLEDRLIELGMLEGDDLYEAYAAADVFAFTSQSETQGMVIAEAMAAGTPVIALDGPGVRDVVNDGKDGQLLPKDASIDEFADALESIAADPDQRRKWGEAASETARDLDEARTSDRLIEIYKNVSVREREPAADEESDPWARLLRRVGAEWELFTQKARASGSVIARQTGKKEKTPDLE